MYTVTQRNTAKFSLLFVIATSIYSCNKQQSSDSQEKYENLVLEAAACGLDITEIEEVKKNLSAREDQQEYTSKLKKINKVAFSEVYLQYHAINEMVDFLNTMRLKDGNNDFIKTKLDYFNNEKNDLTKLVIDMKKNNALLHLDSKNTNKKPLLNTFDASKKTINTIDSVSKKIEIHHLTENELNKLINYENIINKNATKNYTTSKLTKVKKYAYKGVEKFASGANKYNVLMNFVTMPNAFSNINSSFQNGNIGTGIKDSLHLGTNNADLALDLFKASRSAAYWNGHQNTFKNITKVQVALNIASAGFEIYNAVELFKAANVETDPFKKQDYIVNASLNTASAVTSVGTALLLPLSAKAGPIGAAVGFTIMFSQGTYNAVRIADELRRFGFNENYVVPRSIESFFGLYEMDKDLKLRTRKSAHHIQEIYIPGILKENNELFFKNYRDNKQSNLYYISKLIYPQIFLYIPYTHSKYIGDDLSGYKTEQKQLKNEDHICLTNNSYFSENSGELEKAHLNYIQNYSNILQHKETTKDILTPNSIRNKSYLLSYDEYSIYASLKKDLSFTWRNDTDPCPAVDLDKRMVVKQSNNTQEQENLLAAVPANKKANLYFVGYGSQGQQGNMIHTIVADKNTINLFNIHPATFFMQVEGGNNDDIFEFFDEIQNKTEDKGYLDGKNGIDTLNLQGIKEKNLVLSLDQKLKVKSNLPELRNIENVIGSNQEDTIHGNKENNVFFGYNGDDKLFGYDGNDILYPGKGKDILSGGGNNDTYVILKNDLYNSGINNISDYFSLIERNITNIKSEIQKITNTKGNLQSSINKIKNHYSWFREEYNYSPQEYLRNLKDFDYANLDFREVARISENNIKEISSNIIKIETAVTDRGVSSDIRTMKGKINDLKAKFASYTEIISNIENLAKLENDPYRIYISDKIENFQTQLDKINFQQDLLYLLEELNLSYLKIKTQGNEINKNLQSNLTGIKIIDNYDSSFDSKSEAFDVIMTDLNNLRSQKIENDLILGFYVEDNFVPAIIVRSYFASINHQHLLISDLKGNILTSKTGEIFDNTSENSNSKEYKTSIDTYKMKAENSLLNMASMDIKTSIKNIIGTQKNDNITADDKDNIIYGEGGFDSIYGNGGDDTLILNFDSSKNVSQKNILLNNLFLDNNADKFYSTVVGGSGHDSYVYNVNNKDKQNSVYISIIENEDALNKLDNLIINDNENNIKNINFTKFIDLKYKKKHLKIELLDSNLNNTYIIIVKNWFEHQKNRHLQIQLGENLSIPDGVLSQITNILDGKNGSEFNVDFDSETSDVKPNSYYVMKYANLSEAIKFQRIDKTKSENGKIALKFGRINNDLYVQFLEGKVNYSYITIKDFFYWREVVKEDLQVELDDSIILSSEKLDSILEDLLDGEVNQIFN